MKHHPKSNQGVFSKRQKKASRMMMANRFKRQEPMSAEAKLKQKVEKKKKIGILSTLLSSKMRRKAS